MKKLFLTLAFLLLPVFAEAATRFVDITLVSNCTSTNYNIGARDCTGTGTYNAYNTVAAGVTATTTAGDFLYLRTGTYGVATNMWLNASGQPQVPSGTSGSPITVSGCPASLCGTQEIPYLRGAGGGSALTTTGVQSYQTYQYLKIRGGADGCGVVAYGVNISYLNIEVERLGFPSSGSSGTAAHGLCGAPKDSRFAYMHIHDIEGDVTFGGTNSAGPYGVYFFRDTSASQHQTDNNIFEYNEIGTNVYGYGFHLNASNSDSTPAAHNNIVRFNRIHGVSQDQQPLDCSQGACTAGGIGIINANSTLVYGNIVESNGRTGKSWISLQNFGRFNSFYNNTVRTNTGDSKLNFYATTNSAAPFDYASKDLIVRNNAFLDASAGMTFSNGAPADLVADNNWCTQAGTGCEGTTAITFDGAATCLATPDVGSALLDSGYTLSAPFNFDYSGVSRPQGAGYDIGACERQTTAATWTLDVTSVNPTVCAVTVSPNGISGPCPSVTPIVGATNCAFNDGEVVTITAPATCDGNTFTSWTGVNSSNGVVASVTMASIRTATMSFSTPSGQVMWLKSSEGSGTTLADSSGASHPGALDAGTSWSTYRGSTTPVYDATHSGTVTAAAGLSFAGTNTWTIRLSVLPDAVVTDAIKTLIANNSDTINWGLAAYDHTACGAGSTNYYFKSDGGIFFSVCDTHPLSATSATRLTIRYKDGVLTMWKQGFVVATTTASAVIADGSTGSITIGKRTASADPFSGKIWNVILDDRPLSDAEILADSRGSTQMVGRVANVGRVEMQ